MIRCLIGGNINVVEASYGRHDRSTCPHSSTHTTNCDAGNSLSLVQRRCDFKPSCELDARNAVFGDPCRGTYKYLEVKFMCVPQQADMPRPVTVCEGKQATVSCQSGKKISVVDASYGRHDRSTCPHPSIHTTSCHAGNSLSIVKNRCENQASCQLDSNNSVFGDPCRGTYKYLEVKYRCI